MTINFPAVEGASLSHINGNLDFNGLSDYGRILNSINWGGSQVVRDPSSLCYVGLVIDHDNYNHNPGSEDIAESFSTFPYGVSDDLQTVDPISMIVDNGTLQRSYASFQNKGLGTGYSDDILINQTAWTLAGEDWAIIQWDVSNIKTPLADLTNFSLGYEIAFSKEGGRYGVGGSLLDGGDDVDGFDPVNDIYWVTDDTGVTFGVGSALSSDPITHYYGEDYFADYDSDYKYFFENETWLYNRLHAANATATDSVNPGNITTTVGWNGETISQGESRTFSMVFAINGTFNDMIKAVQEARKYYESIATRFLITEIRDSGSGVPRIEVFNYGRPPTDPTGILELTANVGPLTGTWTPAIIPSYGYSYFEPIQNVDSEGDTISLYENSILIEEISYGKEGIVPDPLDLESVARKYDSNPPAIYTDQWLRNASSGPTWGSQNNIGNIISVPQLVLNRVLFNPFLGDEEEGYIELMFNGSGSYDISNYRIICDDEYIISQGTVLNDTNKFYVLKYSDRPSFFSNMTSSGDNVYLYDNNDNLLDMVGWSSAHTQGNYVGRVPDAGGTYQGYNDLTSISSGWVFDQEPRLIISEFSADDPNSSRIEIYNPRGGDKVLSTRWTFEVETSPFTMSGTWTPVSETILSNDYSYFERTGGALIKPEGDTIELYFKGTSISDSVSFGTAGKAPDPIMGESTSRVYNNSILEYTNNWTRNASTGTTWGAQNNVIDNAPSTEIVLNRVLFNPINPIEGYIELMYIGLESLDISGYKIICDEEFIVLQGTSLDAIDRYFVLTQSDFPLNFDLDDGNANGDNVYLYDMNGTFLDMVGWSSPHAQGNFMSRIPNGNGTNDGYNDATSQAAGWVFDNLPRLELTEFYMNDTIAQIEIYNSRGGYKILNSLWSVEVESGSLSGTWVTDPIPPRGYSVFTMSGGNPGLEGDIISLYYSSTNLIDTVSFGIKGLAPDPLTGESTAKYWNEDILNYENYWSRDTSTTFGSKNDIPKPDLDTRLFLNEILFNPSILADGFIELYHKWGGLNISGYKIVGDKEFIVPSGTELTGAYPYFCQIQTMDPTFFSELDTNGDNVYLYDDNDVLLDMTGWSSPHNQGESMSRIPDGNGTRDGFDDTSSQAAGWVFNNPPTLNIINIHTNERLKYGNFDDVIYFNLTVENLQNVDDTILFSNITINGFPIEVLDETGTFKISKISVPSNSSKDIKIKVYFPSSPSLIYWDNITIVIQSENKSMVTNSINLVAYTKSLANAGLDQTIYEGDTIQFNGSIYGFNTNRVWPVELSADGHYLAVGWGNHVSFFSTSSNLPIWTYDTGGQVGDLKLSENGRYLTVGSYKTIYYFDTLSNIPLWSILLGGDDTRYDADPGNRFDMTLDGRFVASTADGGWCKIFDARSSNPTIPYWVIYVSPLIMAVSFSGDGNYIAMGSWSVLKLGWIPTKTINFTYNSGVILGMALSYNGSKIFSHEDAADNFIYFTINFSFPAWKYQYGDQAFEQVMSYDGKFMVSGNRDASGTGDIIFWDYSNWSSDPVWIFHRSYWCEAVDMDYNANYIVGGSWEKKVYLFSRYKDGLPDWNSSDGTPIYTFNTTGEIRYNSVSISMDGKYFAAGGWDGSAYLFSTEGTPHHEWTWQPNYLAQFQGPLTYEWDFNQYKDSNTDGNFTNDVDATGPNPSYIYGDNGIYNVTLKISDGLGASYYDTCKITVNNKNPLIDPIGSLTVDEGVPFVLNASSMDFGSDDLTFKWNWGDGTSDNITVYYNNGISDDPFPSPDGIFPISQNDSVIHVYSTSGVYFINLTVEDDDGGMTYLTIVANVGGVILPPELYINTSLDGNDIVLNWEPKSVANVDHYLIYRSTSQVNFDFSSPWVNTSFHKESGEPVPVPLRIMWNDTNAANPNNLTNYNKEFYYIIRAVSNSGERSRTSRTVGKWTKTFPSGISTFSLPLEPIEALDADYYTTSMNAEYIKYIESGTKTWLTHNLSDGLINNPILILGEGYEVNFSTQTNYTFCGMPGAMISYNDNLGFLGFDPATGAQSLSVSVEPDGNVTLTWQEPSGMGIGDWYEVYYSDTRDGFFGVLGDTYNLACPKVYFGNNSAIHINAGANNPGSQLYYMIVPYNISGIRGSGTYSIGIWTEEYIQGYDTLGIPLKQSNDQTADWYCDNIPNTVGINYYIISKQRWGWHSKLMPKGAFDPVLILSNGYQISTLNDTKYTFIGR